jgi:endogenous inhibitor of DNA gyrase (YacG/DUF329 family)
MAPLRCPICGRPFEPDQTPAMPFCSERCRQVDLGRWLGEGYCIPVEPAEPPEKPQTPETGNQDPGSPA